jgi:formate dehydrogenase major subunit
MGREILAAGLENRAFIERATAGFASYREGLEKYTLEYAERETGVPAAAIRDAAHAYGKAGKAQLCWTLGITEHHNALDNVFALINLALLTGHVGRWGSGVNPLRGQNNVQGGGDMGALPNKLPGGQDVENPKSRAKFERAWHSPIPKSAAGTSPGCSRRWSTESSARSTSSARTPRSPRPTRSARCGS